MNLTEDYERLEDEIDLCKLPEKPWELYPGECVVLPWSGFYACDQLQGIGNKFEDKKTVYEGYGLKDCDNKTEFHTQWCQGIDAAKTVTEGDANELAAATVINSGLYGYNYGTFNLSTGDEVQI